MNEWKKDPETYVYVDDFLKQKCQSIKSFIPVEPYLSFILLSIGIEFIGKCLDSKHKFLDYSKEIPKTQYNIALDKYFKKYKPLYLQGNLRNSMAHSMIPNKSLWLRTKDGTLYNHLSRHKIQGRMRTVIIIEELYNDFETACNNLIKSMKKGDFSPDDKIYKPLLVHKED